MESVEFSEFTVEVYSDEQYSLNSTDSLNKYDFVYCSGSPEAFRQSSFKSQYGVKVKRDKLTIRSAIVISRGGTSPHEKSMMVENDNLILIIGWSVFSFTLPGLQLNWKIENEDCVTCFGLYKIPDGYLVHGELSIFKVGLSGNIEWSFYGRDIFTTPDGTDEIQIHDNLIVVKDWDDNIYRIDMAGNSIN